MKKLILIAAAFILLISAVIFLPRETTDEKIKIGVSDDSSGMIVEYMINSKSSLKFDINKEFETFAVKDC